MAQECNTQFFVFDVHRQMVILCEYSTNTQDKTIYANTECSPCAVIIMWKVSISCIIDQNSIKLHLTSVGCGNKNISTMHYHPMKGSMSMMINIHDHEAESK